MPEIENLWGNLAELPDMDLPKAILEAQKKHLESAVGGMVLADVRQSNSGGKIKISFVVFPCHYEDMEKEIISITHSLSIYPSMVKNCMDSSSEERASDDAELKQIVKRVLSSSDVHHVVNKMRLISMSK